MEPYGATQEPRMSKTLRIICYFFASSALMYAQPRAKAWVSVSSDGTLDLSHSFNSSGALNTVSRVSAGSYRVFYPGLVQNNNFGGITHASSTSTNRRCKTQPLSA